MYIYSIPTQARVVLDHILNILFVGDVASTPDFQNDTEDNSGTDELFDPEEELRIDYLFQEFLLSYLALENQTTLYKMGHKYEDFVFDCNFRGIDCRFCTDHDRILQLIKIWRFESQCVWIWNSTEHVHCHLWIYIYI